MRSCSLLDELAVTVLGHAKPRRGRELRRVFLVHGEPDQQGPLRAELVSRGVDARIPGRGDLVELDV